MKRAREEGSGGGQMCRDFEKGICFRGDRCKFSHPSKQETGEMKIAFCTDFRQVHLLNTSPHHLITSSPPPGHVQVP